MPGESVQTVTAEVKYLTDSNDLAKYIASTGGGDITEHQGNYEFRAVPIHDARNNRHSVGLDREGFVLERSPASVTDFYDEQQIVEIYNNGIRQLVKRATGAREVEIFDHTRRSSSVEVQKQKQIRESASIVHNDYTARSGPNRLRDYYADRPEVAKELLSRRFMIVNAWRSIAGTVKNAHIALCSASSTQNKDLISVERIGKDRIGEIQIATWSPEHEWFYFPDMEPDEVLLFKTYDSLDDGTARFTIHTAFEDPTASEDAPPRESIETRCFVFF